MSENINIANNISASKYINLTEPTAYDVVVWLEANEITAIPCQPKTKKPIRNISRDGIKHRLKIAKNDSSKDDEIGSYHLPTPTRMEIINQWWNSTEFHKKAGIEDESIAVDCVPEYNNGQLLVIIDVDTDDLIIDFMDNPVFNDMPVVRGGRGIKLLTFITPDSKPEFTKSHAIDDSSSLVKDVMFEIFIASKRIALVWGEHPNSTSHNLIKYKFIRGFGEKIPVHDYNELKKEFTVIAKKYDFKVESSKASAYENEPEWNMYIRPSGSQDSIAEKINLRVQDIGFPDKAIRLGDEIVGAHPYHGSTTGQNYRINTYKNCWCCYRCGSSPEHPAGGGPMELAAVMGGIIQCSDAVNGLNKEQFHKTLEYLRKQGYPVMKAYNEWVRDKKIAQKIKESWSKSEEKTAEVTENGS